ncbi:MAG: lipid-A-disaccharide synthase [Bryobacterales bacterium]|nr:lipid-A-disaccharide synthase [Bryobacterales bacterium]
MPPKILISAGEASGEMYASQLVPELLRRFPEATFFGCAGPKMRAAGVRSVVDAEALSVVGLFEVVRHIPRIYREFRKLVAAAKRERPDLAILTDSPDFHFRLAAKLKRMGVPVVYYVAPQVWAWRQGRARTMRKIIDLLVCIFPFEKAFFEERGIPTLYAGHPLTRMFQPSMSRAEFRAKHGLRDDLPLIGLLPGSRAGEWKRHLPVLLDCVERLRERAHAGQDALQFALGVPEGGMPWRIALAREESGGASSAFKKTKKRIAAASIQTVVGETWDLLAHADLLLAASGTVTMEAALAGTPMVTFYKVSPISWKFGRRLVKVPHLTMVNLVAGKRVAPELMQDAATGSSLAAAVEELLSHPEAMEQMREELRRVRDLLSSDSHPIEAAAEAIAAMLRSGGHPEASLR